MTSLPFISVICPTYNEEKFIDECICSVLKQDYPKESLEVLFVDGGSEDKTRDIILSYVDKYPFIRILDNPFRYAPHALNIGIRNCRGEVVVRIDAHCKYPSCYLSVLVSRLQELGADNVGAVLNTLPANNTDLCKAMAIVCSHSFGVGNSVCRVGTDKEERVDTVPFGCFRREVFDRIGFFDEELIRNQDDEFNARIIQSGGKIYIIPSLVIDYTLRDKVSKLMKMYYQYGLFKPLVNKKLKHPATIRQFVPMLFVAGLVLGLILSIFLPWFRWIYFTVLVLYFLLGLAIGVRRAIAVRRPMLALYIPYMFFLLHISYGAGYWKGLFNLLTGKSFVAGSSR